MALDFQYDQLMLAGCDVSNCTAGGVVYGYQFTLRYPSYRGTFLSCIEGFEVKVDGVSIIPEEMRFTLNGKQFLASELDKLCQEYWYVLDDAVVTVLKNGGLSDGEHRIEVEMVHRIPYTGYFGEYLTLTSIGEHIAYVAKGA